ncbi:MAG TPA: DUF4388 domain-containing protein [Candidatus Dormibacteraeota bacterium]|jgi:hypothetical protein|nr:DUF4388 domain-containing protein [Candidatus Dormibacteraeota bacterium]
MALAGSLVDFPLEGVLRLLESARKTGVLEVAVDGDVGTLEISEGNLTAARYGDDVGDAALGAIFGMQEGSFAFRASPTGTPNLAGSIDAILARAIEERQRMLAIREAIPDDRMRFKHSERATSGGPITIAPEHWRVLMKIDGRRDVAALAETLNQGRVTTLRQLHELLEAGLVDALEPSAAPEPPPAPPPPTRATWSAPASAPEPPRAVYMPPETPEPIIEKPTLPPPVVETPPPAREVFEAPRAPAPEPPPAPVFQAPPPPPPPAPAVETPSPNFWETQPPKTSSEDLSTLMQERLAAMQQHQPASSSPEDFWQRMQSQAAAPAPPAPPPAPVAPPVVEESAPAPARISSAADTDHRLAALFGRAEAPVAPPPQQAPEPAPPQTTPRVAPVAEEPVASHYLPPDTTAPILEVDAAAPPPKEEKKRGLLGGLFGAKKDAAPGAVSPEPTTFLTATANAASSPGRLASFANALMTEYNSGQYGKQRLDERMNVRLRLVDEQADPLDRMLPLQDDRLDVGAIDRDFAGEQTSPYLATLVRQIYEDAERLFGKDKAKKGYRAAIRNGLGGDETVLRDRSIVEVLPKL